MRGRTAPDFVQFHDGTQVAYAAPANTLDPRYIACTEHRVACDCREAEQREDLADVNAEFKMLRSAITEILAGHPEGCMCTGCQIARRTHLDHLIDEAMPGPMEKTNV
jgi:hypothetical protein